MSTARWLAARANSKDSRDFAGFLLALSGAMLLGAKRANYNRRGQTIRA